MYCAEVWGFHEGPDIERVHIKFCKMILRVNQSTPSDIVLGETRRVDIKTWRQMAIIKYWIKIINMSSNRHVYNIYCVLKDDAEIGKTNWASMVNNLVYTCGLGEAWLSQSVGNTRVFMSLFRQRLIDIYRHNWCSRLTSNMYCLIKLRTFSHKLAIETGRWHRPHIIPIYKTGCVMSATNWTTNTILF